jgi:hypothetical protein
LVDYYKGLIERTEGFELEGDTLSSDEDEDEEDEDEDSDMVESPADREAGSERAAQWQAWMDENSTKHSGTGQGLATQSAEAGTSTSRVVKRENL